MKISCKWAGALVMSSATMLFGWSVDGVVKSTTGTILDGVNVSVRDSATKFSSTTGADGHFVFQGTTSIQGRATQNAPSFQWNGNSIILQANPGEILDISIFSATGSVLWNKSTEMKSDRQAIAVPSEIAQAVKYVQIRSSVSGVREMAQGPRALAAVASLFPTLDFKKTGYADTSFSMTMETMAGLTVQMRSTAVQPVTCPSPTIAAGTTDRTVKVGGADRTYKLVIPSNYNGSKANPLVLDFHGIGGDGAGQLGGTTYKNLTNAEGVISAYPTGAVSAWNNAKGWNYGPCCTDVDDVGFAREVVKDISKVACVDSKRVYATGFSNGGGMALQLGCEAADVFAAIAPAAFDLSTVHETSCKPSRPISVIAFRSTGDGVVKYPGELSQIVPQHPITFLGAVKSFQLWAKINQCTGSPSAKDNNGCETYSSCAAGVKVTLCTTQGGNHDQGKGTIGWPFLKSYTLP